MLKALLLVAMGLPAIAASILALTPTIQEKWVSRIARTAIQLSLVAALATLIAWGVAGAKTIHLSYGVLRSGSYRAPFTLVLDGYSITYLLLTALLAQVTAKYSHYYLHREDGYQRYFCLILLMITGTELLAVGGTLDLLFAGWELIGFASFLLIGFYRHRVQPIRNAFTVLVVYKICDIGLLAAAMLGHEISSSTGYLFGMPLTGQQPDALPPLIGMLVIGAALGKSAQFPFVNWLSRAMEGPTPSSAIFYGALSIHAGVFLLIRTEPLWGASPYGRAGVAFLGALSALIATAMGRTLPNIKGQIAYASVAQVGLMFIEVACSLTALAMVHLALNSFLRAYQILISPSVMAHALRLMGSFLPASAAALPAPHFTSREILETSPWQRRIYRLTLSEFFLWPSSHAPLLPTVRRLWTKAYQHPLSIWIGWVTASSVIAACLRWYPTLPNQRWQTTLAVAVCGGLMIESAVQAILWKKQALHAWGWVLASTAASFAAAVCLDRGEVQGLIATYYLPVLAAWIAGSVCLLQLGNPRLERYSGKIEGSPRAGNVLLLSLAVISGLPISPVFIGEDLVLHWMLERSTVLAILSSVTMIISTLALARVYVRVCTGPAPA